MKTFSRLVLVVLLVAVFTTSAIAAGKRYVIAHNNSDATIDIGFLQPPSSTVLESYGTLHPRKSQSFAMNAGDTKIVVRSKACHASTYLVLPTREHVTVDVTNGCKVTVQ